MKTTTELKEFAQLAQASYAILNLPSIYKNALATKNALQESPNGAFADQQAVDFTNRYDVLNQFRDNNPTAAGGFSATLFQDRDNPNRVVLGFAGTEPEGGGLTNDLLTDAQVGLVGHAMPQALTPAASGRLIRRNRPASTAAVGFVGYFITGFPAASVPVIDRLAPIHKGG